MYPYDSTTDPQKRQIVIILNVTYTRYLVTHIHLPPTPTPLLVCVVGNDGGSERLVSQFVYRKQPTSVDWYNNRTKSLL